MNVTFPDIRLYQTDLIGDSPDNKITKEYYKRPAGNMDLVFALRQGPFYHASVRMYTTKGELLVKDEDYEFYGIMPSLTAYCKDKAVGVFIKLKKPNITEWVVSYQVVGNYSILSRDFVDYIESGLNDERPVIFVNIKNRPLWYPPSWHVHDIRYEIHSFQDLVDQVKRFKDLKNVLPDNHIVEIDAFQNTISIYIASYKAMLLEYIRKHDSDKLPPYVNTHGLTALQMDLEKVDNFETATYQQILEGIRQDLHITADLVHNALLEIYKQSDELVEQGTLPITWCRSDPKFKWDELTTSGFKIKFYSIRIMMLGKWFTTKDQTLLLTDLTNDPRNKTFYIYVVYRDGNVIYLASLDKLTETTTQAYVGNVKTNNNNIVGYHFPPIVSLNTYRFNFDGSGRGSVDAYFSFGLVVPNPRFRTGDYNSIWAEGDATSWTNNLD